MTDDNWTTEIVVMTETPLDADALHWPLAYLMRVRESLLHVEKERGKRYVFHSVANEPLAIKAAGDLPNRASIRFAEVVQ